MKIITVPTLALAYLTVFPVVAHADRRIRIELPLPEHCQNITDVRQPNGVCRGPLASYRLVGTGELIWKDFGDLEPAELSRVLEEMMGSDDSGQ